MPDLLIENLQITSSRSGARHAELCSHWLTSLYSKGRVAQAFAAAETRTLIEMAEGGEENELGASSRYVMHYEYFSSCHIMRKRQFWVVASLGAPLVAATG